MLVHIRRSICGNAAVQGEPTRFDVPLSDCRRRTGSLFSIAASFERSAVTVVNGASKTFTRNSLTGKDVIFHFCSA